MDNDAALKINVVDELAWRPDINSAHIGVTADNGVVTLTGHVPSYTEKLAAEECVKHVAGVRGVADNLEVRLPGEVSTDDDEIARRALDSLALDFLIPSNAIAVTVERGWVTLSGNVSWQFLKNAAESDVRKLYGVLGVINNITLKQQPQPADVKMRIENALKRSADLDSKSIRVSVTDGTVTLDGTVESWAARDHAEDAAWAAPGVREVRDNLQVGI
jgi:osmotically-inducible protein OsmY